MMSRIFETVKHITPPLVGAVVGAAVGAFLTYYLSKKPVLIYNYTNSNIVNISNANNIIPNASIKIIRNNREESEIKSLNVHTIKIYAESDESTIKSADFSFELSDPDSAVIGVVEKPPSNIQGIACKSDKNNVICNLNKIGYGNGNPHVIEIATSGNEEPKVHVISDFASVQNTLSSQAKPIDVILVMVLGTALAMIMAFNMFSTYVLNIIVKGFEHFLNSEYGIKPDEILSFFFRRLSSNKDVEKPNHEDE